MVIVDEFNAGITGGVDTHLEVHVAAALDPIGGLLGVESFEAGRVGEDKLITWLASFGPVNLVGVEGSGSYGAGLARRLQVAQITVVEVYRPNRQARCRSGKTDPLDAVEAARAAQGGRALGPGQDQRRERGSHPSVVSRSSQCPLCPNQSVEPDPPSRVHCAR